MPRGKPNTKSVSAEVRHAPRYSPQEDEWGGFVGVRLTEEERDKFNEWWSDNAAHLHELVEDVLASGLKLSVSWDGQNQSQIATFTGRPSESVDWPFRCSMSARAATFWEAIALLVYKEKVVTGGDWTPWTVNGRRKETWG